MLASVAKPVSMSGEPMTYTTQAFEPATYHVTCFPARIDESRVENWTLKQLGDDSFHARLRDVLPPEERTYYAPSVNMMSGAVESHDAFAISFCLDGSRRIRRPGYVGTERIACDSTYIGLHDGGIMAAGGCPLIVLNGFGADEEICLFAHGGRDSLIDPGTYDGSSPRKHFSVVDAMVAYAVEQCGVDRKHLFLRSFFSLPWQRFRHDATDDRSQRIRRVLAKRGQESALQLNEEGVQCLSLNTLIKRQAEQLNIAFALDVGLLDLPENGDFAYTRHPNPELGGTMRNLVTLERCAPQH